jgi:hypothetical protein
MGSRENQGSCAVNLRVATDTRCWDSRVPVAPLLAPLLGQQSHAVGATSWERRFDAYGHVASSLFEVTALADADVVVLPGDWYWVRGTSWRSRPDRRRAELVRPLWERALAAGKPIWLFFTGDRSCDRVPFEGVHVFREGPFRSRLEPLDEVLPAFSEDLVASHCGGTPVERPWRPRPTVGFCGLASSKRLPRRLIGDLAFRAVTAVREHRMDPSPQLGEVLRERAVSLLQRDSRLRTNFILRDSKVFFRDADSRDLVDVRREYVDNLVASDYVLCIRGSGNYSYRLYEALCTGRVPIIVDTDLALPLPDEIPWRELAVWVLPNQLDHIGDRVLEFHSRQTAREYIDLQQRLRELWLRRLSPQGFFGWLSQRAVGPA